MGQRETKPGALPLAIGALWIALVALGVWGLAGYKATPGAPGSPPARWPAGTSLPREAGKSSLILWAHPYCPCTRASIHELASLLSPRRSDLSVKVVFSRESKTPLSRPGPSLRGLAESLPGARLVDDDGGLARSFGVATSGHVLLYDASGRLAFSGGITAARGHLGGSAGRDALLSRLRGDPGRAASAPVFGCLLLGAPRNEEGVMRWKS